MNFSSISALVLSLLVVPFNLGCSKGLFVDFNAPPTGGRQALTADPFLPVTTGGQPPPPTDAFYVVQLPFDPLQSASYILEFAKGSSGNAQPIAQITGPAGVSFGEIAVDSGGNLYAQGYNSLTSEFDVYIYPAGATGNATPSGIIANSNASALCLGATGKLYAVGNELDYGIRIYDPTTAAAAPLQTITLSPTVNSVHYIATDASNNIYLLNLSGAKDSQIFVFSASATGNASPLATISGPATGLFNPEGLAVDGAGNIYVGNYDSTTQTGSILVFAPGSTGNVSPVRTISGSDTHLGPIRDVRVDKSGTLYVNAGSASPDRPGYFTPHIITFAPGASGNVAPLADLAPETAAVNHMTENFAKLAVL